MHTHQPRLLDLPDVTFIRGPWKLVFTSLGETLSGGSDSRAPDEPLLYRADLYFKGPSELVGADDDYDADGYCSPPCSSYCTLAPITATQPQLQVGADALFDALEVHATANPAAPWRRSVMEHWTWHDYGVSPPPGAPARAASGQLVQTIEIRASAVLAGLCRRFLTRNASQP